VYDSIRPTIHCTLVNEAGERYLLDAVFQAQKFRIGWAGGRRSRVAPHLLEDVDAAMTCAWGARDHYVVSGGTGISTTTGL
jgi:hypothetical protein